MLITILKKVLELMVSIFFAFLFVIGGKPKYSKNLKKAINLYEQGNSFERLFAQIRAWDAPYDKIEKYIPEVGEIVDLGSGDGLLANFLALSSPKRKVLGIEINKERAQRASRGLKNTSFKTGSIINSKYPTANAFIIAHVLHHLPSKKDQDTVIQSVYKSLKPNGTFIILEIDRKPILKYIFTWLTDAITVPLLFEGKMFTSNFYYRKDEEWKHLLKSIGFSVKEISIHQGTPFSHILFVCTK